MIGGGSPDFFLSQNDPPMRDFQGAEYSGDSKTDEILKKELAERFFRFGPFLTSKRPNQLSLWYIFRTSEEKVSRLFAHLFRVYTTSWCTCRTASRDYCTPHGSVTKKITAAPERASCWNCWRAQKSSVWRTQPVRYCAQNPSVERRKIPSCMTPHTENSSSDATSRGEL